MGKHADTVGLDCEGAAPEPGSERLAAPKHRNGWRRICNPVGVLAIGVSVAAVLITVAGSLGYRVYEDRRSLAEREMFLQAARMGAVNLTTIDHNTVDADITRILDSSTGAFQDDFRTRATSFAEVVRRAQSTSEGTVTNAAIETADAEQAHVLVIVSVKMSSAGAVEEQPQSWRMRIAVEKAGETAKVSDVQFVT